MNLMTLQVLGGTVLFLLVAWQLSVGLRWIRLGRNQFRIHRATGITLAILAVPHAINGLLIAGVIRL